VGTERIQRITVEEFDDHGECGVDLDTDEKL
jgi:hypothetical protein